MFRDTMQEIGIDFTGPAGLAAALVFVAVLFIGASILFLREQHRKAMRRRLEAGDFGDIQLGDSARKSRFVRLLEGVGNFVSHGHATTSLWEQLIRAGYMSRGAPAIYTGIKIVLFTTGLMVTAIVLMPMELSVVQKTWWIAIGGVGPFFLPNLFVLYKEGKRRQEIQHYLPDVVDLLEICVSSGIGLDMAWNVVADEIHHVSPVLGTAMDLSNFEMHLGASRTEAMRNMAARTGADQLSSLAAILVQSERFGTSVAVALSEFASSMREERRMTAEESAEKMSVKMVIPMVLCIFPAVIIVTAGPAAINIARTLLP
jgi:tight adherence protein C